eukprot:scaffold8930_cov46-Cylindrotheca_fusiformis.AAC.1
MDPRNVLSIIGRTTTSRMCFNPYGADGFDHLFAARERDQFDDDYSIIAGAGRDDVRTFKICGRILGGSHKSGGCPNANRNGK